MHTGSGGPQICIKCLDTVQKAASLKNCLHNHKKFFKTPRENSQKSKQDPSGLTLPSTSVAPSNQCPGCLKTTVEQLAGVEIMQDEVQHRMCNQCCEKNDRLKRFLVYDEYGCIGKAVPAQAKEKIGETLKGSQEELGEGIHADDDVEMISTEGGDTRSSIVTDLSYHLAVVQEEAEQEDEAMSFAENIDVPEIETDKADDLDDFKNTDDDNAVEDSKSVASSNDELVEEQTVQGGLQQSEENAVLDGSATFETGTNDYKFSLGTIIALSFFLVDDLTCSCGFKAVSAPGLKRHQRSKRCKQVNREVKNDDTTNARGDPLTLQFASPYACLYYGCSKSYILKTSLILHLKTHAGKSPPL